MSSDSEDEQNYDESLGLSQVFECPVSLDEMETPVMTICGHTFEQTFLDQCLAKKTQCPNCNRDLKDVEKPYQINYALIGARDQYNKVKSRIASKIKDQQRKHKHSSAMISSQQNRMMEEKLMQLQKEKQIYEEKMLQAQQLAEQTRMVAHEQSLIVEQSREREEAQRLARDQEFQKMKEQVAQLKRKAAEEEALRKEQEKLREAEAAARKKAERARKKAEAEAAKKQSEAERIKAAAEAARKKAEAETALLKAKQEEASRLKAEQEAATRLRAEQENAARKSKLEAARLKAEQEEAARLKAEQEAARLKAEKIEATRKAMDAIKKQKKAEEIRKKAEEDAERKKRAEAEKRRLKAEWLKISNPSSKMTISESVLRKKRLRKQDEMHMKDLNEFKARLQIKRKKFLENFEEPTTTTTDSVATTTTMNSSLFGSLLGAIGFGYEEKGDIVKDASTFTFGDNLGTASDTPVWLGTLVAEEEELEEQTEGYTIAIKELGTTCKRLKFRKLTFETLDKPSDEIESDQVKILREAMILYYVNHSKIIKLQSVFQGVQKRRGRYYMALPYVTCDLDYYVRQPEWRMNKIQRIISVMYQVLLAMSYLHSAGVVHRDIEPNSVLVTTNSGLNTRLCSFGFARSVSQPMDPLPHGPSGYYGFRAPELLMISGKVQAEFSAQDWKAADVWSVGCLLAYLLRGGKSLFSGMGEDKMLQSILRIVDIRDSMGTMTERFGMLNAHDAIANDPDSTLEQQIFSAKYLKRKDYNRAKPLLHLLRKLLNFDMSQRITIFEALCHPVFTDLRDRLLALPASKYTYKKSKKVFSDKNIPKFIAEHCAGLF